MSNYQGKSILLITRIVKGKNHIFDKLNAQYVALKNLNLNVDFVYIDENYNIILNKTIIGHVFSRIGIQFLFFSKLKQVIHMNKYDFIYIRNPFLLNQISYFNFLRTAKIKKIKVVLEIPTYPYEKEINGILSKFILITEKIFQSKLKKYISLIVYSGNSYEKIYGIKSIQLSNVANSDLIPISKTNNNSDSEILKLIGVSSCHDYHGYDRIIEGLHLYNNSGIHIEFHIIGDGPELTKYRNLLEKYKLYDKVFLHGKVYGNDLNTLFDGMDIGVSCLGMHRIGLESGSPLKSAEYALRGIPFLLAYNDPFFSNQNFCCNLPADETPILFDDIIHWFSNNTFKRSEIRELTKTNVSWEKQFDNLISTINE